MNGRLFRFAEGAEDWEIFERRCFKDSSNLPSKAVSFILEIGFRLAWPVKITREQLGCF